MNLVVALEGLLWLLKDDWSFWGLVCTEAMPSISCVILSILWKPTGTATVIPSILKAEITRPGELSFSGDDR